AGTDRHDHFHKPTSSRRARTAHGRKSKTPLVELEASGRRHLWQGNARLWSVALASGDAGDPHIELIACVHAHPHTDWLDFRITTLAAIKVDQEGLPSFQEASDLAIARIVGITVSRDVDAVDDFRTSAASIPVVLPGNRTPVAMEGGRYAIGRQCWRCCGGN